MTTKTKIITAVIIGVLAASGIAVIRQKKTTLAEAPPMKCYAMVVSTVETKSEPVQLSLPYLAILQSDKNVVLSSRIAARIEKMVKCGSHIHKGDLLVKLDQRELQAKKVALQFQIASTKADLAAKKSALSSAQASHQRTEALLEVKGASQESYDKETTEIAALQAALSSLRNKIGILHSGISELEASLSYAVLTSPIEGIVSKCYANQGDLSVPGKPLLSIESRNEKYLLARTADNILPKALIYQDKRYPLIPMHHSFNGLDEYRAYIQSDRPSGERINVSLVIYEGEGIKIPLGALLQKEQKAYCFVSGGDRARPVEVQIIARGEDGVVVEGLKAGDKVVTAKPDILLKLLSGVPIVTGGI